jgi:oligogalacturonide lyase
MLTHLPPEWIQSPGIAAAGVQWTSAQSMSHHFYFTNPTVTPDGKTGFFVSYRSGHPNLYRICLNTGELTQFSHRVDINPFSPAPSANPADPHVYVSARRSVWAINYLTGQETELARFPSGKMGNCSLNASGTLLAIGVRESDHCKLALIETQTGKTTILTQGPEIGHIQFCPIDDDLLLFSGPLLKRLWVHSRKTGQDRYLYPQPSGPDGQDWITHESWVGGSKSIIFSHWPRALMTLNVESPGESVRTIAKVNAWHACSNRAGTQIVCDTNHPDQGLLLIDAATGTYKVLCKPQATCRGTQWVFDVPKAGAGIDVSIIRSETPEADPAPTPQDPASTYGPQWTHPHPTFTADGRNVIFTSDHAEFSQVYSVPVA